MESIDDIYSADEAEQPQEELSPAELIQDIIGSLRELTEQVSSDSVEDVASLTSDLQNIANSLKELLSSDEDDYDTNDSEEFEEPEEELEEEYGTEGYGPHIDKDGVQNYEVSAKEADSYPQRKGFVGM